MESSGISPFGAGGEKHPRDGNGDAAVAEDPGDQNIDVDPTELPIGAIDAYDDSIRFEGVENESSDGFGLEELRGEKALKTLEERIPPDSEPGGEGEGEFAEVDVRRAVHGENEDGEGVDPALVESEISLEGVGEGFILLRVPELNHICFFHDCKYDAGAFLQLHISLF